MKLINKLTLLATLAVLAACDNGSSTPPPIASGPDEEPLAKFALQMLHASPDAPAVDIFVESADVTTALLPTDVDYKAGTGAAELDIGTYTVRVDGKTPDGPVTVIGPLDVTFEADTLYSIVAAGDVASIAPIVLTQPNDPVPAGSVRLRVLHAAPLAPEVDVYATAPGVDLAASAPIGTFSFGEDLGPIEVPADDYQVRVTLPDDPDAVVFDSGTISLADGSNLLVAAVENTTTGDSPISLVAMTGAGVVEILDADAPAHLRVVHASPDAPAVDIVVNGDFDNPLIEDLAFPDYVGFVPVSADDYNVKVTAANNPGAIVIDEDLTLDAGVSYDVIAFDSLANITPLVAADDFRRVATEAKVRLIHGSVLAGPVDIWITATDADITMVAPTLTNVPLGANTGFLSLAAGTYALNIAPTGTTDAAISEEITVEAGGVYTGIARDSEGPMAPLGIIGLDDAAD
jgi:hypothetical protein